MSKAAAKTVTIANKLGLHARPATMFVACASNFNSEISVRRTDHSDSVDGKSIMKMMMLAATQGTQLEISATGDDADAAVDALQKLVESKFEEE